MTQRIRLLQEGFTRAAGYQLTQWVSSLTALGTTAGLAPLFLMRRTSTGEAFERVATLLDFVTYGENELNCFELRGVGGDAIFVASAGDPLTITTPPDYWLQSGAPYADAAFVVDSVRSLSGTAPTSAPSLRVGGYFSLPGYAFTDDDVGRWFSLSGFTTTVYNVPALVVQVLTPNTALVVLQGAVPVVTNEAGTAWATRRLAVAVGTDPTLEPRYFPTLERGLGWSLTHGTVRTGANGNVSRDLPDADLFLTQRLTTLEATLDAANTRASDVRTLVTALQIAADQLNTSFLGVRETDVPTP